MVPPEQDMVLDEALRIRGGRPSTPSQEDVAPNPRSTGRDFLDAIETFDRIPPASRPVFFDGSDSYEEDSITPHTTTDDL